MCYADTIANDDGTITAYCYCGWTEDHPNETAADTAAERHQNRQDEALTTA